MSKLIYRIAAKTLWSGGVIAYPTEGVWGLGCDPFNCNAVSRLLALKSRPSEKGLILVADSVDRLTGLVDPLPEGIEGEPGQRPLTWVVPHGGAAADWLSGGRATVAIRITRHPVIVALCRHSGLPLVSTSANPSGKPSARSALQVRRYFQRGMDLIVPGELGGQVGASEIRDYQTGAQLRPAGT